MVTFFLIVLRDAVCVVVGHRVKWGETSCARCGNVPGDELAP